MLYWIRNFSPNCTEGHFASLGTSHSLSPLAVATHLSSAQNDPSLDNSHCILFMFASTSEAKVIRHIGNYSGSILVHVYVNIQQFAHHFINHSYCSKDIKIFTAQSGGAVKCRSTMHCDLLAWGAACQVAQDLQDLRGSLSQGVPGQFGVRGRLRSTSLSVCKKTHSHRVAKPAKQHLWNSQRAKCCSP